MPLTYLPLIIYTGWMELMTESFVAPFAAAGGSKKDEIATNARDQGF